MDHSKYLRLQKILEEYVARDCVVKHPMKSIHEVSTMNSLVVHASSGQAMKNSSSLLLHSLYVCMMTGQYPCVTKVKRPVSLFFMRHNMPIGVKVTLRRKLLFDFLDKVTAHVLAKQQDVYPSRAPLSKGPLKKGESLTLGCDFVHLFPEMEHFFVNVNMGCDMSLTFHQKKASSSRVLASSVQVVVV